MFPIVQNLNALAANVHQLKHEMHEIRNSVSKAGVQGNVSGGQIPADVIDDIKSLAAQTTQGVNDVKKYVDVVKADVTRDISMLEAMISRKCEVTMNKMINDKINIILESQRSGSKDIATTVKDELNSEIAANKMRIHELVQELNSVKTDLLSVRAELSAEREAVANALKMEGGTSVSALASDESNGESGEVDNDIERMIVTGRGSSKGSSKSTVARRSVKIKC
jgi:hypothetical protein